MYKGVYQLKDGRAFVQDRNGKWGAVDQVGTLVIPTLFHSYKSVAGDRTSNADVLEDAVILRCQSGLTIRHREGKRWIEKSDGTLISDRPFDMIKRFPRDCSNPLVIKQDGFWGFATHDGHIFPTPPSFEVAKGFFKGNARVMAKGKWGVIGEDGRFLVDPVFDDLRRAGGAVFRAELNGLVVWIDSNGKRVPAPDWQAENRRSILECPGGATLFHQHGRWGMRGPEDSVLIKPVHRALDCYRQGVAWAARDGWRQWCPIGLDGNWQAGPNCRKRYAPLWVSHHRPEKLTTDEYESSILWMLNFLEYGANLRGQPPKFVGDGAQGHGEFFVDKRHRRREWELR